MGAGAGVALLQDFGAEASSGSNPFKLVSADVSQDDDDDDGSVVSSLPAVSEE